MVPGFSYKYCLLAFTCRSNKTQSNQTKSHFKAQLSQRLSTTFQYFSTLNVSKNYVLAKTSEIPQSVTSVDIKKKAKGKRKNRHSAVVEPSKVFAGLSNP